MTPLIQSVMTLLEDSSIPHDAKLRLAILYALRYQKYGGNQIANMVKKLLEVGVDESRAAVSCFTGSSGSSSLSRRPDQFLRFVFGSLSL